jgi:hypothetical protein
MAGGAIAKVEAWRRLALVAAKFAKEKAVSSLDPFSGRPFVTRKHGGIVQVYSVGQNLADDGGPTAFNTIGDDFGVTIR